MAFDTKYTRFEGTNEYVTMGNVLGFERTNAFSFSFWFRAIPNGTWQIVLSKNTTSTFTGYQVTIDSAGLLGLWLENNDGGGNRIYVRTTANYCDGAWHHAVISFSGSSLASGVVIIVDGSTASTTAVYDALTSNIANSASFMLGGRTDGGFCYVGHLDEVAIYNKALTLTEAQWIYNSGVPRDLSLAAAPSNLVAWWRMGEGDSTASNGLIDNGPFPPVLGAYPTYVWDLSGNDYYGTMTNMEAGDIVFDHSNSSTAKSITFDSVNEYVDMGNVLAFERTDPFSWSCWFRIGTVQATNYLLGKVGPPASGYQLYVTSSGTMVCDLMHSTIASQYIALSVAAPAAIDGAWHHVAVTWDGDATPGVGGLRIYLDGSLCPVSSTTDTLNSYSIVNSNPLQIGGTSYGTPYSLGGNMDEVAAYSKELTQAEVTWIYNGGIPRPLTDSGCPSNLAGWWRMGDGDTYPTLTDNSTGGHNGTMTNMEAIDFATETPGNPKYAVRCLSFGGTNEYVTMGNVLAFERTNSFSVAFWFKSLDSSGPYLVSKMGTATAYRGYGCALDSGGVLAFMLRSDQATVNRILVKTVASGYNDGAWHHVAWCYDGSSTAAGCTCYVDGVAKTLTTITDALTSTIVSSIPLVLAAGEGGAASFYTGDMDDVVVYNKALSLAEAQWIYNGGNPRNIKGTGAPSGLVAWWRLGESGYPGSMTNMESTDFILGGPSGLPGVDLPLTFYSDAKDEARPGVLLALGGSGVVTYYKMRAQDGGAAPPGYVSWTGTTPDLAGVGYSGGQPIPIGTMVVGSVIIGIKS